MGKVRWTLFIDEDLKKDIFDIAQQEGRKANSLVSFVLAMYVSNAKLPEEEPELTDEEYARIREAQIAAFDAANGGPPVRMEDTGLDGTEDISPQDPRPDAEAEEKPPEGG